MQPAGGQRLNLSIGDPDPGGLTACPREGSIGGGYALVRDKTLWPNLSRSGLRLVLLGSSSPVRICFHRLALRFMKEQAVNRSLHLCGKTETAEEAAVHSAESPESRQSPSGAGGGEVPCSVGEVAL